MHKTCHANCRQNLWRRFIRYDEKEYNKIYIVEKLAFLQLEIESKRTIIKTMWQ